MKLSIITINYNNSEGLRKTIDSVVSQTWQEFEWIIVDGGSIDGSRELIEQTASQLETQDWTTKQFSGPDDPAAYIADNTPSTQSANPHSLIPTTRCLLWCSERDKGIYNAMNKGIVHAQGEYCLFLNSGDCFYDCDVLSKAFSYEFNLGIVCFNQIFDKPGPIEYSSKVSEKSFNVLYLLGGTLPHQATLIKRELFITVGLYDEALIVVADWKFFVLSIVFYNVTCCYYPVDFAIIQMEGLSMSQIKLREQERKTIKDAFFPRLVQQDYRKVESLTYVLNASWLCRKLYGLLFRLASLSMHKSQSNNQLNSL